MGKKFFNILMEICFITFIIELVLGFNGRFIVLWNIPIREMLFGLVALGLGIKALMVIKDNRYNGKESNQYE